MRKTNIGLLAAVLKLEANSRAGTKIHGKYRKFFSCEDYKNTVAFLNSALFFIFLYIFK